MGCPGIEAARPRANDRLAALTPDEVFSARLNRAAHYLKPRLNGRSLRWCSPRGRCDDCDLRYGQVLGVAEPANSLASTPAVRRLTSAST